MSNPAYQNYLIELQNFVNAIGKDSAQDKSDSYSGPRDFNGQPNGYGKMIFSDESVYEGQFLHGLKNEKGIHTWPNGDRYEGEWTDNQMTGKGIFTWSDGSVYEGNLILGVNNGMGKCWDSNGMLTGAGLWENDKIKDGWGVIFDENGIRYEGEIKEGKQTGMSVEITSFPVGSDLFIDNKPLGKTPYTGNMIFGSHNLRIENQGSKTEKVIQLTHGGTDNFSLSLGLFTETVFDINLEMVFVEGGTFQMGSNDGEAREKPVHSVTLSDFYIGKYEVTQKQWRVVMGNNPSYFSGCDNHPVEQVSWDDVQEFIKRLNQKTGNNYRLPTEAEWEYAARGGNKSNEYIYSGSNSVGDVAWYNGNSGLKTHPVGQKQSNELGLSDMSGNVFEWCSDWWSEYYQSSATSNPKGPSSGSDRVFRGGSWGIGAQYCRTSIRRSCLPEGRSDFLGFRLVLVP